MSVSIEQQVREKASRKGMELVRLSSDGDLGPADQLYQLTATAQRMRVYPQGIGIEGVPLREIESWLDWPWE